MSVHHMILYVYKLTDNCAKVFTEKTTTKQQPNIMEISHVRQEKGAGDNSDNEKTSGSFTL